MAKYRLITRLYVNRHGISLWLRWIGFTFRDDAEFYSVRYGDHCWSRRIVGPWRFTVKWP